MLLFNCFVSGFLSLSVGVAEWPSVEKELFILFAVHAFRVMRSDNVSTSFQFGNLLLTIQDSTAVGVPQCYML